MPLEAGSSESVVSNNIAELIDAGHSRAQSAAIAYKEAGKDATDIIRAAGVMYIADNCVLLMKRTGSDIWAFPGGKIEGDETPAAAAVRECVEETGHSPSEWMTQFDYSNNGKVEFTTYLSREPKFDVTLNDEHSEFAWSPLDALPAPLHPGVSLTLDKFLKTCVGMDLADTKRVPDTNGWPEIKDNPISKAGVFDYMGRSIGAPEADKIYKVYRPESELSDQECIDSFKLLPWVDDHTMMGPDGSGYTAPEDKGVHGVIGEEIYFRNGTLYGNLKIFSNSLAKLIEAGKKQLSAGYRCAYEMTSGIWNGQPYDAIQRNIRGNHLALVAEGRMGPEVSVLDHVAFDHLIFTLDAKDIPMTEEEKSKKEAEDRAAKDAAEAETKAKKDAEDKAAKDASEEEEKKKKDGEDKAAKDAAEAEKKKDAEDEDDDGKEGMDAAIAKAVAPLVTEIEGLKKNGIKAMLAEVAQRDVLAGQVSQFIGTFDHAEMTLDEVASYSVSKLGLKCPKGTEKVALEGYLHGRKPSTQATGVGLDAAPHSDELSKYLSRE